jgi:hypothetical protein
VAGPSTGAASSGPTAAKTETDAERQTRKRARKVTKAAKAARKEERRRRREAHAAFESAPAAAAEAKIVPTGADCPAVGAAIRVKKQRKRAEVPREGRGARASLSSPTGTCLRRPDAP